MDGVPSFVEMLTRMAAGGVAGVVLSFVLEHVAAFQRVSGETRKWLVLGMFVGLPIAATAALQFVPGAVWVVLEPYWRALALGFVAWVGSQAAHEWDKRSKAK